MLGGWLAPHLSRLFSDSATQLLVSLLVTFTLAILLAAVGDKLAIKLQSSFKFKPAHMLNSLLGVVLGIGFVLLASWLIASALTRLPFAQFSLAVDQSKIVQTMNRVMPPAPRVMEKIGRLVSPQGFPQVFVGQEPELDSAGPPVSPDVEAAAALARDSVARIEGLACGSISVGSGFIASPHHVVTNAHVVAGVKKPVVLIQGKRYTAKIVWFDPDLDFAVLKTDVRLASQPLKLTDKTVPRGTTTAILGFPGGGELTIRPGVVLRDQIALGRDIYGGDVVSRKIYALQASIQTGNSGGPVVLPSGEVAGIIFGGAVDKQTVAYALTSEAVADDLARALKQNSSVRSGPCL